MPTLARRPIGFAHRGARAECPDNTLVSFRRALELGATGLESDAWITADGVAVLDHDGRVGRGLRRKSVADLPRSALPAHVPTLAQLYGLCREAGAGAVPLSLDIKDPRAVDVVVAEARAAGTAEALWLCAPDPGLLGEWRRHHPDVHLVFSARPEDLGDDPTAGAAALARVGVGAVNLRAPGWTPPRIAAVHAAGLGAFGWDAQDEPTLRRLVDLGVDAVYSDHVALMMRVVGGAHAGRPRITVDSEPVQTGQRPDPGEGVPDDQVAGHRSDDPGVG